MPRRAFSLIELLVVLVIIALLVGILLPTLASTRDAARQTACLANLKQLITGVANYAVNQRGRIPYGPSSNGLSGGTDFYVVDGQVTNQISTETGEPMAAGLMLGDALLDVPESLFCPGVDTELQARKELAKVGSDFALSSYRYRHGSNTFGYTHPVTQPRLDELGVNRFGSPARALFMDHNFLLSDGSFYRPLFHQTNHGQRAVNLAYADGSATTAENHDARFTADVGTNLYAGLEKMLLSFERADLE